MTAPVPLTLPVVLDLPRLVAEGVEPSAEHAVSTEVVLADPAALAVERLADGGDPVWVVDLLTERVLVVVRGLGGLLAAVGPGATRNLAAEWQTSVSTEAAQ